jgi:hypothetical protein
LNFSCLPIGSKPGPTVRSLSCLPHFLPQSCSPVRFHSPFCFEEAGSCFCSVWAQIFIFAAHWIWLYFLLPRARSQIYLRRLSAMRFRFSFGRSSRSPAFCRVSSVFCYSVLPPAWCCSFTAAEFSCRSSLRALPADRSPRWLPCSCVHASVRDREAHLCLAIFFNSQLCVEWLQREAGIVLESPDQMTREFLVQITLLWRFPERAH